MKNNISIVVSIVLASLAVMFIPLNAIPSVILKGISVAIFLGFLIYAYSSNCKAIPKIITILSVLILAINLNLTRSGLINYETVGVVEAKSIVLSSITILVLLTCQVFIVSRGCRRTSEIAARYALDTMNQKMYDIDTRLNQGVISKSEGEELKADLRKEIEFYSGMDGASRFLSGIAKANVALTLVNLAGGVLVQVIRLESDLWHAVGNAVVVTGGNVVVFTVPVVVVGMVGTLLGGRKFKEEEIKK